VDAAYNLNGALGLLLSDSIDVVLLCHTVPKDKQRSFISAAHACSNGRVEKTKPLFKLTYKFAIWR
jgi:hypothetical protein